MQGLGVRPAAYAAHERAEDVAAERLGHVDDVERDPEPRRDRACVARVVDAAARARPDGGRRVVGRDPGPVVDRHDVGALPHEARGGDRAVHATGEGDDDAQDGMLPAPPTGASGSSIEPPGPRRPVAPGRPPPFLPPDLRAPYPRPFRRSAVPGPFPPVILADGTPVAPPAGPAPAGPAPAPAAAPGAPPAPSPAPPVSGAAPGAAATSTADGAAPEAASPGFGSTLPLILAIFAIFYLMMIRPQAKEKKKRDELLKQVKKHDRVVTTAGLHGEVVAVSEATITLRVDENVRLTFDRSAIWQVRTKESDAAAEAAADAKEAKADAKEAKAGRDAALVAAKEKGKA